MRTFCFQIHVAPLADAQTRGQTIAPVLQAIDEGAAAVIGLPEIVSGDDFTNISIDARSPLAFWSAARPLLEDLSIKLIVVSQGEQGWEDYLLLYHFDPAERLDDPPDRGMSLGVI